MHFLPRKKIKTIPVTAAGGARNAVVFDIPSAAKLVEVWGLWVNDVNDNLVLRPNDMGSSSDMDSARIWSQSTTRSASSTTNEITIARGGTNVSFFNGLFWVETGQIRTYTGVAAININSADYSFVGYWGDTTTPITKIALREVTGSNGIIPGSVFTLFEIPLF